MVGVFSVCPWPFQLHQCFRRPSLYFNAELFHCYYRLSLFLKKGVPGSIRNTIAKGVLSWWEDSQGTVSSVFTLFAQVCFGRQSRWLRGKLLKGSRWANMWGKIKNHLKPVCGLSFQSRLTLRILLRGVYEGRNLGDSFSNKVALF